MAAKKSRILMFVLALINKTNRSVWAGVFWSLSFHFCKESKVKSGTDVAGPSAPRHKYSLKIKSIPRSGLHLQLLVCDLPVRSQMIRGCPEEGAVII